MKRLNLLSLFLAGAVAASIAGADVRAQYRIVMKDGRVMLSRDLPRQEGTITRFHAAASGVMTRVRTGEIARVETSVTPQRFVPETGPGVPGATDTGVRPLQPGEVVVLGPIGADAGTSIAAQAAAAGAINGGGGSGTGVNGNAGAGAYGASRGGNFVNGNGTFSNGTPNGTTGFDTRMLGGGTPTTGTGLLPNGQQANQPLAGDVLRAQSGDVPTMNIDTQTQTSPNGFPANTASQTTTLNPSGQPNTAVTGPVAGSTQPIGPNGFPGTPQNVTGPNGFPVTGGTATSSQNVTGPNGFTGPTQSTPQNVTNPNGFPAVGAPGTGTAATGAGQVIVLPNGTITNVQGANRGTTGTGNSAIPQQQQQRGTQQKSGAPNAPGPGGAAPSGGAAAPSGSSGPGH